VISGINVDRLVGGKVVEEWASYDLLGAMRQLGTIAESEQEETGSQAPHRSIAGD